jgi:hypothetical protein
MRRTVILLIMCAALTMPLVARADDQTIPPEAQWTPTPPARSTVDVHQLASVLVEKGMITPHEYTHLTQPQASSLSPHSLSRAGTWDDTDRDPVRSTSD